MNLPRTAISLYVALAIHGLLALLFAFQPAPQGPSGRQVGFSTAPVTLGDDDRDFLQAASAASEVVAENDLRAPTASGSTPLPPTATGRSATAPLPKPIRRSTTVSPPAAPGLEASATAGSPRNTAEVAGSQEPEPPGGREPRDDLYRLPGAPAQQAVGGVSSGYLSDLRRHLANYRRRLPLEQVAAVAVIDVQIQADGRVGRIHLAQPSGVPALDQEALDLVHRAAPLPRPPGGRPVRLSIPIHIHQAAR